LNGKEKQNSNFGGREYGGKEEGKASVYDQMIKKEISLPTGADRIL